MVVAGQYRAVLDGTWWYSMVLGQYKMVGTGWHLVVMVQYWPIFLYIARAFID